MEGWGIDLAARPLRFIPEAAAHERRLAWGSSFAARPRSRAIAAALDRCVGMTWGGGRRWLERAGRAALRVVAPDYCAACDAPVLDENVFCEACGPSPVAPSEIAHGAMVGGAYAPPLSIAIRRLKFGQRTDLAGRLSALLPPNIGASAAAFDSMPRAAAAKALVVPVPLHLTRLVERGYNAPALLASCWCRRLGLEFAPRLLTRWKDTPQQSALPAEERARNVEGAFIAHPGAHRGGHRGAAGRHAILIDDVITTGATIAACSQALYAAGVVHVTVIALAATPLARSRG